MTRLHCPAISPLRGGLDDRGSLTVEESPDSMRQRCRVTPGGGNPRESATENETARIRAGKGETVG